MDFETLILRYFMKSRNCQSHQYTVKSSFIFSLLGQ
jgi:hypothetical protein